jgi:hemerythrin-like domain-containing protein
VDAIQVILKDHREVERLFKELERGGAHHGDADRRRETVRRLVRELAVHSVVEEQLVYPALREAGAEERVLDALEEHHAVKVTLAELEQLSPTSERFEPKVRLLAESVRRHVEEEERELLPLLERTFEPGPRRTLGEALERAKRAAPTRPHPTAPDTPPGNFVVGAFAAVYDRTRDALRAALTMLRTVVAQGASRALQSAAELGAQAQRWGTEAVEQGREAVESAARRGRDVVEEAGEATARIELRGTQAARDVRRSGRAAARAAREGARSAARGAARGYRAGGRAKRTSTRTSKRRR